MKRGMKHYRCVKHGHISREDELVRVRNDGPVIVRGCPKCKSTNINEYREAKA
jgi:hypothetical protein